jgi:hypothetical protein
MSANLGKVQGGIFNDIILWVRRIIKSSNSSAITNETIGQYINRFCVYDMPERLQLLEFKRQYTFETIPNIMEYQAPFTSASAPVFPFNANPPPFINNPDPSAAQTVMPVYQNFLPPIYCDGVQMGWLQSNDQFYKIFPEFVNNEIPLLGDGSTTSFSTFVASSPILKAFIDDLGNLKPYVYITAFNSAGDLMYIVDTPYKNSSGLGILVQTDSTFQNIIGPVPTGSPPSVGGSGTVDYSTGELNFTFNAPPADQANIQTQTSPFSPGFPRMCLFFNNTFKLFPVPSRSYKIQMDAYITPTVFFNTGASVPFGYMSEYIARGAARKILADSGDMQQIQEMEPFFKEQENLVLRRSDRQRSVMRTPTIFSGQTQNNSCQYTQY